MDIQLHGGCTVSGCRKFTPSLDGVDIYMYRDKIKHTFMLWPQRMQLQNPHSLNLDLLHPGPSVRSCK